METSSAHHRELQTAGSRHCWEKIPIPRIDEVFDCLGEGKIFGTCDLAPRFHDGIYPGTVPLTSFSTSSGVYEWPRMPQRAATESGYFHSLIQHVREGLPHVIIHLGDAIAFGASPIAHVRI